MSADADRQAQAREFATFADYAEKIHRRMVKPVGEEVSEDYWRGANDAADYFIARLRSHADFLIHGHGD